MMRVCLRSLAAPLALAVLASARPQSASAQSRGDTVTVVPRELVEALLRPYVGFSASSSRFYIGEVPTALAPFLYVPPKTRVIGGLSGPTASYVVMTSSLPASDIASSYEREQPKLGWTTPSPAGARGWGFVTAPRATYNGAGVEFCHVGQSLQVVPLTTGPNTTQITVTVQNFGGRCQGAERVAFVGQTGATSPTALPLLENPIGSEMNSRECFQPVPASLGATGTSERVLTTLSPSQLVDAFAKQLADSGWKTADATQGAIRRVWTHADTGGLTREATLQVSPMSGSGNERCLEASLNVRTLRGR